MGKTEELLQRAKDFGQPPEADKDVDAPSRYDVLVNTAFIRIRDILDMVHMGDRPKVKAACLIMIRELLAQVSDQIDEEDL